VRAPRKHPPIAGRPADSGLDPSSDGPVMALWRRFSASPAGQLLEEFVQLRAVDRALALASKLFIAILPMSILVTAVVSEEAFGEELVVRFGLDGAGAQAARVLFATPAEVQAGIGWLGLVILVSSILSFARALERLYLDCWRVPASTEHTMGKRVAWLASFVLSIAALAVVHDAIGASGRPALTWPAALVVGALFFLWTPYVLLGRRIAVRRLLPTAILTGAGMLALAIGSDLFMPELVTRNTVRYGLIGFTFSLVSWLFSGALLIVTAAIIGALLDGSPAARRLRST
jgi:membrane protein